jgi:ubiquinone/menaquinone biosynthesis C-methylase UbiE
MNRLETYFCATTFWSNVTRERLLPRMLDGAEVGTRVLELGAGSGAATPELLRRFPRVTSLEYSAAMVPRIAAAQVEGRTAQMVRGDAAQLPFADVTFTCAIAILMLHHLRSPELQNSALAEIRRVLQPGGIFLAFEIRDGWLQRLIHTRSTFVPVNASTANARLNAAGFARVSVDFMRGAFLLRAQRAAD